MNSPHFKLVVARLLDQTLIVSAVTRIFEISRSESSFLENMGGECLRPLLSAVPCLFCLPH